MQLERTMRVEPGGAPGEFRMVLATEGEASDGHILSIAGGVIPERLPLQEGHSPFAKDNLGSIVRSEKDFASVPPRLVADGVIELTGDGEPLAVRRDLANMIDRGHVNAVSIRWDTVKSTPRIDLPPDHHAHVSRSESDWRKRSGEFIEEWVATEGSLVAVGADKAALIMRHAESCQGRVRDFWRSVAAGAIDEGGNAMADDTLQEIRDELRVIRRSLRNARGESLGAFLSNAIDDQITEDMPRPDVIASIASAAGISESTVNQIVNGSIECPPVDRLEGIAEALGISASSVISAAERDGCDYGERSARSCNCSPEPDQATESRADQPETTEEADQRPRPVSREEISKLLDDNAARMRGAFRQELDRATGKVTK